MVRFTQEMTRQRNWNKARLLGGLHLTPTVLTQEEIDIMSQIVKLRAQLLKDWDKNSAALGLNIKPFRCVVCNRGSVKEYKQNGVTYCLKHYKQQLDYQGV